jgi:hypothetical protein
VYDDGIASVCVAVHHVGMAPHELICFNPSVDLAANPAQSGVDWEAVEAALRGLLIKIHHLHHFLPAPSAGAQCMQC